MCNRVDCKLCAVPALVRCFERCNGCSKPVRPTTQYAAVDALVDTHTLPFVNNHHLNSRMPSPFVSCQDTYISFVSTLLALLGTYRHFSNIIHVGVPDDVTPADLVNICDTLRADTHTGQTIVCQPLVGDGNIKNFAITRSASTRTITVHETTTIDVISRILDGDNNLCCYWGSEVAWYAHAIHNTGRNMWVCTTAKGLTRDVRPIGSGGAKAMQFFHIDPRESATLILNYGLAVMDTQNIDGSLSKFSIASTAADITNSVLRDNRCYFCSYVMHVHNSYLKKDSDYDEEHQMELCPDFSETTFSSVS